MSEKLHTPEPWIEAGPSFGAEKMAEVTEIVTVYGEDDDEECDTICEFPSYIDKETRAANARRIVACVNACKDIPSEKLDGLATMARLGIELTDAINDPDGRFNRLEKEHYANEFALDKAGISGEDCGAKVSKGIELLTAQRDELLAALKGVVSGKDIVFECVCEADTEEILQSKQMTASILWRQAREAVKKYDHA